MEDIIPQNKVLLDGEHVQSFKSLQHELRQRGLFERDTKHVLAELVFHYLLTSFGLSAFVMLDGFLCKSAATVIWTAGLLAIATNTHTSAHYATFQSKWLNELFTFVGFPLITGISASHWWAKHSRHHKNPNIVGVDKDLDLRPFFLVTDVEQRHAAGVARAYCSVQWVLLPLAVCLLALNWQKNSLVFLIGALANHRQRRLEHWLDLGCVVLHFVMWILIPCQLFAPIDVLAFYGLKYITLGCATFVTFAPSHFPQDAACAPESEQHADFVLKQTATTVNYHTGRLGALLSSGLGYQIEHHLFPGVSHTHYPMASHLVREFCRTNGYPYRTMGWGEAVAKACYVFVTPKRVVSTLQDCRCNSDMRSSVAVASVTMSVGYEEQLSRDSENTRS